MLFIEAYNLTNPASNSKNVNKKNKLIKQRLITDVAETNLSQSHPKNV